MSRAIAREYLMHCVYQMDIKQEISMEAVKMYLANLRDVEEAADLEYIEANVKHYIAHHEEIDQEITNHLKGWKFERISHIDLAVIRVALTEILYFEGVPYKVAINEAVNLANKFGDDHSGAFVNGLLGEAIRGRGLETAGDNKGTGKKSLQEVVADLESNEALVKEAIAAKQQNESET